MLLLKTKGIMPPKGYDKRKLAYRTEFKGLPISIENAKGSYRYWYDPIKDENGRTQMKYPYGYIRATEGRDGDSIDVFIGPNKTSDRVFVVRQQDPKTKKYDEDKVMLGFVSADEAKKAYLANYDDKGFFGGIVELPFNDFQTKVTRKKKGAVQFFKKSLVIMVKSEMSSESSSNKWKFRRVMMEFRQGKLRSSDGKIVTDKDQALAIAYSESGLK